MRGVYGDAQRIRSGFLFRVIDLQQPIPCRIVYDGWWFRQKLTVDGVPTWRKISWLTIEREVAFRLPAEVHPECLSGRLEIDFGRGLMIRRFRVWIDQQLVYDEING